MNKFFTTILLYWIIFTPAHVSGQALQKGPSEDKKVTGQEKQFIHAYFEAERYKLLEDYEQSIIEYQKCISLIPQESSPYYQIGKLQLYVFNDLSNADYYINEAISLDPKNEWYYYDLLTIYGLQNNIKEKQKVYENLIQIDPENEFYYFEHIKSFIEMENYRGALKSIKNTEKKLGVSNQSLRLSKEVYIQQNKLKEAEKIGNKLVERSPLFYSDLAEIYMHFSQYEKAITTYNKLLEFFPRNPSALIALHKIYYNKKDIKNEENILFKIASNEDVSVATKKEIFSTKLINNQFSKYQSFQEIVESAVTLHPEEPLFHLILGDIYTKKKKYEEAIEEYRLSLYSNIIKDDYVYNKLIQIFWEKENMDSIIKVTKEAIDRFPFSPEFYYYKGLALYRTTQYQECLESLTKGKSFVFDNNLLISDFYSLMGDAYHKIENHLESDESYEQSLKHNPENALVLNNYSYYLSQRDEKLLHAKTMIIKCIELSSDMPNASYIDTYAWVLYKLGEYNLAKEKIEQAIDLQKNSSVIWEHYGDIVHKLGLKNEAIIYWEKALQIDSKNSNLIEKINNRSNDD